MPADQMEYDDESALLDLGAAAKAAISPTMRSNLYTMGVTSKRDARQLLPAVPETRPVEVRKLRAALLLEEALETCRALGFSILPTGHGAIASIEDVRLIDNHAGPDLEGIVDGCCDAIYVAVGTLAAHGIADVAPMAAVCRANDAKFPGGVALTNPNGKFLKPQGWQPPAHNAVIQAQTVNLAALSAAIVGAAAKG